MAPDQEAELQYCTRAVRELMEETDGSPRPTALVQMLVREREHAVRGVFYVVCGMRSATELASDQLTGAVSADGANSQMLSNAGRLLRAVVESMRQMEELTRVLSAGRHVREPSTFGPLEALVDRARLTLWSVASAYEKLGQAAPARIERAIAALTDD